MILIIQNGYLGTSIDAYLDDDFRIFKSYEDNLALINVEEYDLVIILGGHQSVKNIELYQPLSAVIALIKRCDDAQIPVLGICLGSQLIAHYLGCKIEKSKEMNIGYDTVVELEGQIYEGILRSHHEYIVPNDKIDILSWFRGIPYIVRSSKMIGIQCHPDIPPEQCDKFINPSQIEHTMIVPKEVTDGNNLRLMEKLISMLRKN